MAFNWGKDTSNPNPAEVDGNKPPEKTPAEIIAESVAEALKPLAARFDGYDDKFAKLEEQTKPAPPKPPVVGEPTSVLDDENLAFAQRLTPLLARQFELESTIVRDRIVREYQGAGYGDLIAQFEVDINKILDAAPLVTNDGKPFRGDPQYIRNVIDMVMGREAKKAGMRFDGKSKGFFLETAGSSLDVSHTSAGDGMTEGQRKVFSRMGVPLDKAKDVIKKLQFVQ